MNIAVPEAVTPPEEKEKGPMDWNAFDFSKDESFNSANDAIAQEALDVDTFFKNIDGSGGMEVATGLSQGEVRLTSMLFRCIARHFDTNWYCCN